MIRYLTSLWSNTTRRRSALTLASGALIVLGLTLPQLLPVSDGLRHGLFVTAALLAMSDIAARGLGALRNRHVGIELLVTVAAAGALVIGETWEAAAVTFLFLFGAYLEARTLRRTRAALQDLLELAPTTAIVLRDGRQQIVAPHEVVSGETVLVKPGSKVPVDGAVSDGSSFVDESSITGEPMAAAKAAGTQVFAGTINGSGLLHVRASGVGADTTLARIIRRVEEAQEEKAPTQRFIERFASWYTPAVILLALGAGLITADIRLALTLLVIGCPGALVISTPVSIVAGIGRAARSGILIKGGEHLERAGRITALALDKTGTLTTGSPRITSSIPFDGSPAAVGHPRSSGAPGSVDRTGQPRPNAPGSPFQAPRGAVATGIALAPETAQAVTEADLLHWAAVAEQGSEHPLAKPILDAAQANGLVPQPDAFESSTGFGVQAFLRGRSVAVGNERLMEALEVELPTSVRESLAQLRESATTPVLVALDGALLGIIGISDPPREDAERVVRSLSRKLRRVVMLTGDEEGTARAVADRVGVTEVRAGLLPEQKLEAVRALQDEGEVVAMLGDGINDAPALAAADVGIAMGAGGSDVAIDTADIALVADDLKRLPEAIGLSKRTLANIRQNLAIALVTVGGLLAGVLLGQVHMAGGMLIHEASVLLVILNAMRLMR